MYIYNTHIYTYINTLDMCTRINCERRYIVSTHENPHICTLAYVYIRVTLARARGYDNDDGDDDARNFVAMEFR